MRSRCCWFSILSCSKSTRCSTCACAFVGAGRARTKVHVWRLPQQHRQRTNTPATPAPTTPKTPYLAHVFLVRELRLQLGDGRLGRRVFERKLLHQHPLGVDAVLQEAQHLVGVCLARVCVLRACVCTQGGVQGTAWLVACSCRLLPRACATAAAARASTRVRALQHAPRMTARLNSYVCCLVSRMRSSTSSISVWMSTMSFARPSCSCRRRVHAWMHACSQQCAGLHPRVWLSTQAHAPGQRTS
jgi:hypothetical protein